MKFGPLLIACATSVAGWMIAPSSASAQNAISFSLGGGGTATMASTDLAGAPGVRVANWNNVSGMSAQGSVATFPNGAIVQNNGASTGMLTATITAGNTGFGGNFATTGATTNDAQMFNGVFDQYNGTPTTISITNIPYPSYNVYFYMRDDGAARAGSFTIGTTTYFVRGGAGNPTTTGTGYVLSTDTTGNGASTQQGNYVVFTNLSGNLNASIVAFNAGDGTQRDKITGFEIVQVPEPGTIALLCGGGAGLVLAGVRRARGTKA